ncbi:globin domain-containing protein (plasmid) [Bradyrhizobium septentrionale]|uniref:Globin domain-containing protein n=1 Tax=Bradyrhizobium septentrionale TaxID=1404411 RepID=A0A974A6J7_9BRAD|nr:globin domain-containing protein [Bradyrhizobium septentrionale]UGY11982.1 globin domain-containing protein [Bradyrhizobium septentrionale]UGY30185.1 globin domain-containing protein [Bradyrhizobium septentrionale]
MTPEQVDLVRTSFDAMWPIRRDLADLCYNRFVELAPDARQTFGGDTEKQRMKVLDMITALVASLDERPMFQSLIAISGHKHAILGFQPSHFVAMGEALMWSFERKFGASFTPELRESWHTLYATAQNEMLRATGRHSSF